MRKILVTICVLLMLSGVVGQAEDDASRLAKCLSRLLEAAVDANVVVDRWFSRGTDIPIGWSEVTADSVLVIDLTDVRMMRRAFRRAQGQLVLARYCAEGREVSRATAGPAGPCPQLDIGRANVIEHRTFPHWRGFVIDTAMGSYLVGGPERSGPIFPLAALPPSIRGPLPHAAVKQATDELVVTLYEDDEVVQAVRAETARKVHKPVVLAYRKVKDQLLAVIGDRTEPRWRADAAASAGYLVTGPPGRMVSLAQRQEIVDKCLPPGADEVLSSIGTCAIGGTDEHVAAYWTHHRIARDDHGTRIAADIHMLSSRSGDHSRLLYASFTVSGGEKSLSWNSKDRKLVRSVDRNPLPLCPLLNGEYPYTIGAGKAADVIWAYEPGAMLRIRLNGEEE